LRIKHDSFGKTVTPDGSVYFAQEIVIHTPAEHMINGKKYDMEIQIIHNGKSVGDIGKQLILSFIFEKEAGVYNKFIDDLDFFNLPNPTSPAVDIVNDLFIPKILHTSDEKEEVTGMRNFSFYTYQGSLTAPPCSEDTIMYVNSKPIPIGTTALHLFEEALRIPDMMDDKGNVQISDWIPISNRNIQPLNGRPVFHYDHEKYCGPDKQKEKAQKLGHFEKIKSVTEKYFYVPGKKVSGIPNAFLVSKDEAYNTRSDRP
jgi:carbonic anhydrase